MRVLVVVDHPREDSFTRAVAASFTAVLEAVGHAVERAEQARILRNDAIVMVFPVWWWSLPATLKGWIDRVWNNGWAYGARNLAGTKAMMIGIAATGAAELGRTFTARFA